MYGKYLMYATDILHYETLQADLTGFLLRCGADPVELPRLNASGYRAAIPDPVINHITEWYALEREVLGYAKYRTVAGNKVDAKGRETGPEERPPIEFTYGDIAGGDLSAGR